MKAVTLKAPGGLENIIVSEIADPGRPGKGEIRVAIKASSLNYHDLIVASGHFPTGMAGSCCQMVRALWRKWEKALKRSA